MTVVQLAFKLVIMIAAGFFGRKLRVMADGFDKMLSKFVIAIPVPCLIINSFNFEFSMQDLMDSPLLLLLSAVSMALCYGLGRLITARMQDKGTAKAVCFALMFTNFTFFGLPVVGELYGAHALFYYVIFTLIVRILLYGVGPIMLSEKHREPDIKATLKQFFSPPVVAVFIGFALYILQIKLPLPLESAISSIGAMASPLGLMLCGTIIADADLKDIKRFPCLIWVTALRLLFIPAMFVLLFSLIGLEKEMIKTVTFYFAMPVASFLPAFCLSYNPKDVYAREAGSYMVVVSTVICVFTVPLWAALLELI